MSNWRDNPVFGLDNGLAAANRRLAIIWTNAEPIHLCIYVALGGDHLNVKHRSHPINMHQTRVASFWIEPIPFVLTWGDATISKHEVQKLVLLFNHRVGQWVTRLHEIWAGWFHPVAVPMLNSHRKSWNQSVHVCYEEVSLVLHKCVEGHHKLGFQHKIGIS